MQMEDLMISDTSDYGAMLLMNDSTMSNDSFQASTTSLPPPQANSSMTSSMTSLKGLETLREGEVHNGLGATKNTSLSGSETKDTPKEVT